MRTGATSLKLLAQRVHHSPATTRAGHWGAPTGESARWLATRLRTASALPQTRCSAAQQSPEASRAFILAGSSAVVNSPQRIARGNLGDVQFHAPTQSKRVDQLDASARVARELRIYAALLDGGCSIPRSLPSHTRVAVDHQADRASVQRFDHLRRDRDNPGREQKRRARRTIEKQFIED